MKKKAVICDLDGTLCNCDHRRHLVERKKWDEFYALMDKDTPNKWCVDLLSSLSANGYEIVFVSGRPERYRATTLKWLDHHVESWTYRDKLFMRKDGDFRKDSIVKSEIYQNEIEPHFDVHFCIDDRKQVVDMWRSLGLVCLQCAEGDF